MTTGFLWTEQFEEAKKALYNDNEGKSQSMELDRETLDGDWVKDPETGIDFYIINDAIFSKLCILGDDVEPCFEGASIKQPDVSTSFAKDASAFQHTLYTMMQDLKKALEGGQKVEENKTALPEGVEQVDTEIQPSDAETSYKKGEEETSKEKEKEDTSNSNSEEEDSKNEENKEDVEEDKKKEKDYTCKEKEEKYALLEAQYEDLKAKYSLLDSNYQKLVEFKNQIESEKKDKLIDSFYMLSDEDKAEIIANKTQYSYDDIEAKLSVICFRKKVNFNLDEEPNKTVEDAEDPAITYSLAETESSIPAWIGALKNTQKSRK
jgi:molecular chaperone GrpE (heat shock protein)